MSNMSDEDTTSIIDYKSTFPHFLYGALLDYGLTKEQFASRAGMTPRGVSRYLPGKQQELPKEEIPGMRMSALLSAVDKTIEDLERYHFRARHKLVCISLGQPFASLDSSAKCTLFDTLFKQLSASHQKATSVSDLEDDPRPTYKYDYVAGHIRLSGQQAKKLFGGFIDECMRIKKWSLEDLANKAGYHEKTYRRLLKDNGLMQPDEIKIPLYQASLAAVDRCHADFVDFCTESRTEFFAIDLDPFAGRRYPNVYGRAPCPSEVCDSDRARFIANVLEKVQCSGVCIVTGIVRNCSSYLLRVTSPKNNELSFKFYEITRFPGSA